MTYVQAEQPTADWCEIARKYVPDSTTCRIFRVLHDTTDFYEVNYGDVLLLNGVGYLVRGTESEKKFGLEGEPKPWVKSCVNLVTGDRKIVKLTFMEEFPCRIEGLGFTCMRNPDKEARILQCVRGHPGFMQGFHVIDAGGNKVRILDRIPGVSLDNVVRSIPCDHETYYREHLHGILTGLVSAYRSMGDLHEMGEIHGDITPDHLYVETGTGRYRWIDFDYDYKEKDNVFMRDIFEMGTLLSFVVGKDYLVFRDIRLYHPEIAVLLGREDMQSVFPNQLANLKLVYPYIDDKINSILLRFSQGSKDRYHTAYDLADDMEAAAASLVRNA
ncbi:MAG: hypothetical protein RDU20_19795 [Desulfomonilaceae bacterium]|nr:hypothetical protein [Desulfomonilaceae bacterium]